MRTVAGLVAVACLGVVVLDTIREAKTEAVPEEAAAVRAAGRVRMAMGRVRIGWSLRVPKTETRNRNPNPKPKPIRVEIHHQNQTRGYPKPEWIPKTRR